MTTNLEVYPLDFPGIGSTVSQTEIDIARLQEEANSQARKQLYSNIVAGLMAIRNQQALPGVGTSLTLMPFAKVAPTSLPTVPSELGTVGYFYAGNNMLKHAGAPIYDTTVTRMEFLSESVAIAGFQATVNRRWPGTVGDAQRFWALGGWLAEDGMKNDTLDKVHMPSETCVRSGESASAGLFQTVGCGAKYTGYWFGSFGSGWYSGKDDSVSRSMHRIAFAAESLTLLSEQFPTNRSAAIGTAGSRFNAYLFGGQGYDISLTETGRMQFYDTIEQFAYNGETLSSLGVGIADQYHRYTVKFGNANHIYIVNPTIPGLKNTGETSAFKVIHRFTLATSTLEALGISSDKYSWAAGGMGNSGSGYWGGGFNPRWFTGEERPMIMINRTETLKGMSGVETTYPLGLMAADQANPSGISNYAAGYAS